MSPSRYTGLAGPIPVSRSVLLAQRRDQPQLVEFGRPQLDTRRRMSAMTFWTSSCSLSSSAAVAAGSRTSKCLGPPSCSHDAAKAAPSLDRGAAGAQEHLGLAQAVQVGGDGAVGAVLGTQVPLERPSQGRSGRLVHDTSAS
jgi:hypothetical protein